MNGLLERFLEYVKVDSQSDPHSNTSPSTAKQKDMAKKLVMELYQLGLADVTIDDFGYIMATLPANTKKPVATIGFIAHYDTSPDYNGTGINPQVHKDYNGEALLINEQLDAWLRPEEFPELNQYKGQTLITTDGTTLLGADDKAGIAEIMTALDYLIKHPKIKRGPIRIAFVPDEEIGRGAQFFDLQRFGAEWAYTVDGGGIGEIQHESFNAANVIVDFQGRGIDPGIAKGQMVNALGMARAFMGMLPAEEVPEKTSGSQGFFHMTKLLGDVEKARLHLIISDIDEEHYKARKELLAYCRDRVNEEQKGDYCSLNIMEEYTNMKPIIDEHLHAVEIAVRSIVETGIKPLNRPIRGMTDAVHLSFKGMPCINLFTGGHNFHGPYEYIPLESMEKAVQVIVRIAERTQKRFKSNGKMRKN
ncbi:peptidase T [Aureicoccus marinus]|uniref:Peptidase T n=1 Tax=Aureicoccus marinus TaxID=754435 RepID=A0A2S7T3Y8_9FLAO|nr:peptidase T [Aureicoccus marinus]PQJ14613.1 peptidase T [Aureicoccus marinus]